MEHRVGDIHPQVDCFSRLVCATQFMVSTRALNTRKPGLSMEPPGHIGLQGRERPGAEREKHCVVGRLVSSLDARK